MNEEYKPISFTSYDPNNSFFKSKASDKSRYTIYSCCNCENCEAYKRDKCVLKNGLWGEFCPYGKKESHEGYTKRAKNCSHFIYEAKEKYGKENLKELSTLDFLCNIGDYIYIPLAHLNNYVNSIDKKLEIEEEHFIKKEKFDKTLIVQLLNYHPQALFGGEISDFQKKEIPKLVRQLKRYYNNLYKQVLKEFPSVSKYIENIDYRKKLALVKTLSPGKISLDSGGYDIGIWDGNKIILPSKAISFNKLNPDDKILIFPNDDSYVYIYDNNTVTEDTIFKDE